MGLALGNDRGAVDPVRAAAIYKQGCDANDAWGCNNLAVLRARGLGGAKDEAQANALLLGACQAGLPEACANQRLLTGGSLRREGDIRTGPLLMSAARPYTR